MTVLRVVTLWTLSLIFVCIVAYNLAATVTCRDDNGNPIEWFYATKLPRNSSRSGARLMANGSAYFYLLSSEPDTTEWTPSTYAIDNPRSMFGRTLSVLYSKPPNLNYVLYNDEEPGGRVAIVGGHMKGNWWVARAEILYASSFDYFEGVLAFDEDTGFWLVHSVPKYPNSSDSSSYGYPTTGHTYAQSFLCITFNSSQANSIGSQFKYSLPNIYDYHLDNWVESRMIDLWAVVVNSAVVSESPWYNVSEIYSTTGLKFTCFAKHPNFNQDLYADLVAPVLKTNLWVETWQHGSGKIPSECTKYSVKNVKTVRIEPDSYRYGNGHDHSKWAVAPTEPPRKPWFCSGDINRMESQFKRGGGTVCVSLFRVQDVYNRSTVATELCTQLI